MGIRLAPVEPNYWTFIQRYYAAFEEPLMPYEYDVFISYAHLDNEAFTREQQGWVTVFDNVLQIMLNQQLAAPPARQELHGNDDFSAEISDKLPNAATLAPCSPRVTQLTGVKEIKVFAVGS
jgi:hypothetical protein